jgi:hypothetical protein
LLQQGVHIVVAEDRLRAIEESIAQVKQLIESLQSEEGKIGDWLSEDDTMRLSGLGKTTLYNLRRAGQLSSSTISGRGVFYRKSELENILNKNETRS